LLSTGHIINGVVEVQPSLAIGDPALSQRATSAKVLQEATVEILLCLREAVSSEVTRKP